MTTKPAPMENGAAAATGGGNRRRGGRWCYAGAGALLVALLAVAVSSRSFPGTPPSPPGGCGCPAARKYTGMVEDCCCDYETVDAINEEVLHPILQELVKLPFFRYFKVKLWCDCPFWPDDGMCRLRDCSVCECPENEFPEPFKKPYSGLSPDSMICQEGKPQAAVDKTLDNEMTYVNLQLNPERYTGYTGDSARRIWDSIYKENCPKYPSEELCHEKKALYKLISGLHSSISVHIAYDYLLDESTNLWGQNLPLLYDRVLKYPERVQNLYFTYLFVLRAVTKAAEYLEQAEYNTGNPEDDLKTQSLVKQLLYHQKLRSACPKPFDEAKLWQGENVHNMHTHHLIPYPCIIFFISAIMDCVGCEKCRLWGKLQVLGLGTALEILFSVDGDNHLNQPVCSSFSLQLQRNEVIALFNLLNRLSESVKFVHEKGSSIEEVIKEQSPPTVQKSASKPDLKL
ncbi:Endoplasmic reticulum oxidoreductin-1, partial [Dichanthelium oligosanthes]